MYQQVIFARRLTSGGDNYSVIGAGAKLKIYIGDQGEIIGAQGGWRDVKPKNEIDIMSSEDAWELFETYSLDVCLATPPAYEDLDIKNTTLGYYEEPCGIRQIYLIPTYIFKVDFIIENEVLCDGYICIPASESFIPPIAEIMVVWATVKIREWQ